jgi:hypothetical protein
MYWAPSWAMFSHTHPVTLFVMKLITEIFHDGGKKFFFCRKLGSLVFNKKFSNIGLIVQREAIQVQHYISPFFQKLKKSSKKNGMSEMHTR